MKKIVRTLCLIWWGIFGCAGILLFTGCSWKQEKPEKTNLAFTVVDEARLPEELLKLVTEKKEASFKMTYADSGYLYLCVGYGKQDSGGYSITVDDLYASGEMIYLDTSLIGPKQAKEKHRLRTKQWCLTEEHGKMQKIQQTFGSCRTRLLCNSGG